MIGVTPLLIPIHPVIFQILTVAIPTTNFVVHLTIGDLTPPIDTTTIALSKTSSAIILINVGIGIIDTHRTTGISMTVTPNARPVISTNPVHLGPIIGTHHSPLTDCRIRITRLTPIQEMRQLVDVL